MEVCKTIMQMLTIIIKHAFSGEQIENIIIDINDTVNECFNKLMIEMFSHELKMTNIIIMYDSLIIYSYYDQTIGNKPIKDFLENYMQIHEINASLLFSGNFIYISNEINMNLDTNINGFRRSGFETGDGTTGCHQEIYENLKDSKKEKVDILLNYLHNNDTLSYRLYIDFYENIIITKFILMLLLKKMILMNPHMFLNQINEDFGNDREIIEFAINNRNCNSFLFASKELRSDRKIIKMCVSQNGLLLRLASTNLKDDREIVIIAVSQNSSALQFASTDLRADNEIIEIARNSNI